MSKTALITGASSGIGYELAKCFARDGASLVLVARDETRLGQVAAELRSPSVSVRVVPADLARAVAPSEILDATRAANINVDYLVNNAGFGFCGFFERDSGGSALRCTAMEAPRVRSVLRGDALDERREVRVQARSPAASG